MLKKLNRVCNILIIVLIVAFVGYGLYVVWEYHTHPDVYAMQSAPWYIGIGLYGLLTIIIMTVVVLIKLWIWHKGK